jgi:alpha-tubulin suppressor-like RCC1 family protein
MSLLLHLLQGVAANSKAGLQSDLYQVASISGGKDQTLALLKSGEVLGWGGAGSGRVTPPFVDICSSFKVADAKPVYVGKLSACSHISAGYGVSLSVSNQQQTLIWGFCQVGIGGQNIFSEEPTLISGIANATQVVAGQFLYAAVDSVGKVFTWGFNTDGALGRSSTQTNASPEVIASLPEIQNIAIGDNFMIALSKDQRVYGWGSNSAGQLGLGHLNMVTSPELITLNSKIKNIAAGSTHVLALTTDGNVFGWGSNHFGQIGLSQGFSSQPKPIAFPEKIIAIAAGMHYSLALSDSGKVYAWGWNGFGQLGLGDLKSRSTPTPIPNLSGVRAIAAGEAHALAIGKSQLLGWGSNESGQLGQAVVRQMTPHAFLAIA